MKIEKRNKKVMKIIGILKEYTYRIWNILKYNETQTMKNEDNFNEKTSKECKKPVEKYKGLYKIRNEYNAESEKK